MVKMRVREGRHLAVFVCDICGRPIEDNMGTVVSRDKPTDGEFVDVLHAHKGGCDEEAERRMGGAESGWHELYQHVIQLGNGIGMTSREIAEYEAHMRELGGLG